MELSELKYPSMRDELIGYVDALASKEYQASAWVSGGGAAEHDELDYAIHFLYDDTSLATNPNKAIGWFLKDEREAEAVKRLIVALDKVFEVHGTDLDDAAYIASHEWNDVVAAAAGVQEALRDLR